MRFLVAMTCVAALGLTAFGGNEPAAAIRGGAVVLSEFIYEVAPFPQCHASTIVETPGGLVAAWFGGTREKHPDVGIWVSRREGERWTAPVEVANGIQYRDMEGKAHRHPCWNPVLFRAPGGGLMLFYKVGPDPDTWWGMLMESDDGGKTWSAPRRLPEGILGPVKNKPVLLAGGVLLCPSSTEHDGWRIHMERTADGGRTWERTGALQDKSTLPSIQPTLLVHGDGRIQALCRSTKGVISTTWSKDGGRTWSAVERTALPNPSSGIDAVTLKDGRHLLVYNHTTRQGPGPKGREMLNVAVSRDGLNWEAALVLENEAGAEFSYPAVIQAADGRVHITYTWKRQRVKHVVLAPEKLELKAMEGGRWPGGK